MDFNFARSSGPGGQNVNKVNTKAEIRFHVQSADWLSQDVRDRLEEYFSNKITKDGEIVVTSQEHRYVPPLPFDQQCLFSHSMSMK
jgi:peptidyl-tRNA hydrolase ICT1